MFVKHLFLSDLFTVLHRLKILVLFSLEGQTIPQEMSKMFLTLVLLELCIGG